MLGDGKSLPVATPYFLDIWRPDSTSESVIVGCRREWSIIFARSSRFTFSVLGRAVDAIVGGEGVYLDWEIETGSLGGEI